jgi:hypothetical protein
MIVKCGRDGLPELRRQFAQDTWRAVSVEATLVALRDGVVSLDLD